LGTGFPAIPISGDLPGIPPHSPDKERYKERISMDRMIFIAGQGHSGSTLLDMLLSSGGRAVSLGEIMTVVKRRGEKIYTGRCSCGVNAVDCDFWKPVLAEFEARGEAATVAEKYRLILARVDALYGTQMHIIDSSKNFRSLKAVEEFADFEIMPIHLVRDVRSFSISMMDKSIKRDGKIRALEPEKLFVNWYRHNRYIEAHLEAVERYRNFRVVYEELALSTNTTVQRINEYLGDGYADLNGRFNSHIISGNRMKNKIGAPGDIYYDFRWFSRSEWIRPFTLMPFVRRYNQRIYKENG
jgi:hypothetical protein